jgi:hypothetical protein
MPKSKKKAWQQEARQAREAYTIEKTIQNARCPRGLSIYLLQIRTLAAFLRPEGRNQPNPGPDSF